MSPQEFNDLPRKDKRSMERSLEKQGLETPKIEERVGMSESVDKELFLAASKILDRNNMSMSYFLDLALANLIKAE